MTTNRQPLRDGVAVNAVVGILALLGSPGFLVAADSFTRLSPKRTPPTFTSRIILRSTAAGFCTGLIRSIATAPPFVVALLMVVGRCRWRKIWLFEGFPFGVRGSAFAKTAFVRRKAVARGRGAAGR